MLIEQLTPKIVTAVQKDVFLRCQAASEDILDIAYIWAHNGLRIPRSEYENTNIVSTKCDLPADLIQDRSYS